jgi:hypothetical protein
MKLSSYSETMRVRALVMGLILLVLLLAQSVSANDYISHPSNIPLFGDFNSPAIEPGDSATFTMSIKNRYENSMDNITLTVGLYASATYYEYTLLEDVENPPSLAGQGTEAQFQVPDMVFNESVYVNFTIKSESDTTQGTYFVRFQLEFQYNNTPFIMKSRGYFSDSEWDAATFSANETHPGRINIGVLGVDGILPDSSFKVWSKIPIWPLYVCIIPLIVVLGVLALMFYAQEEYNTFPWLDQGFKYWSGKLHQSWRLLKHRFRKA